MSDFYQNAANFLKGFEGFTSKATWDVNAYRIGHGSDTLTLNDGTFRKVRKGDTTTRELAARDLARRIEKEFEPRVSKQIGEKYYEELPNPAKIALISLAYNYGGLKVKDGHLQPIIDAARTGDVDKLADAIVESTKNDNRGTPYYEGLRKRRKKEADFARSEKKQNKKPFSKKEDSKIDLDQVFVTALFVVSVYVLYNKIKSK
jgi:GH24 family phage-related lysozyme (muramidase)